jgi:putative acetyltransferase
VEPPKPLADLGHRPWEVRVVGSIEEVATVRGLFREYERSLTTDLCFQDFEGEVRSLPGPYAPPHGALLLGFVEGEVAGCAGLRPRSDGAGELKRLFVRERYRRSGLGRGLVEQIISIARANRCPTLVLDTLPEMELAQRLYREMGFRETEPYGDHQSPGMRYFRFDLRGSG